MNASWRIRWCGIGVDPFSHLSSVLVATGGSTSRLTCSRVSPASSLASRRALGTGQVTVTHAPDVSKRPFPQIAATMSPRHGSLVGGKAVNWRKRVRGVPVWFLTIAGVVGLAFNLIDGAGSEHPLSLVLVTGIWTGLGYLVWRGVVWWRFRGDAGTVTGSRL